MKKKVLIIASNATTSKPDHGRTGTVLPKIAHPFAEFEQAGLSDHSITDGNVVTGQNSASAKGFGEKIVEL